MPHSVSRPREWAIEAMAWGSRREAIHERIQLRGSQRCPRNRLAVSGRVAAMVRKLVRPPVNQGVRIKDRSRL